MNTLNIMTWNVDWFRNGNHSGSNDSIYLYTDCSNEACISIIENIKVFLDKENSIVILQEVPYRLLNEYYRMVKHDFWECFIQEFPEEKYTIFRTGKQALRSTIAITKKNKFKEFSYLNDNNRVISVENGNIKLVGVHMPTHFKKDDDDDKFWTEIIEYAKKTDNLILAGDFNVYIGCNEKLTEQRYLELLNYMGNCVSENISTFRRNSIDKILLKKGMYFNSATYSVSSPNVKCSDHKPIVMELRIGS